jgi:Basophilic leukemia-expressed protein Bles03
MNSRKSDKPNLDLIEMVQRARMMHDAEAKPSETGGTYWIEAKPFGDVPAVTARAGQWLIVAPLDEVDALWDIVKRATQQGRLGYKAKVSTAPIPNRMNSEARLIVVCTRDADDAGDVQHIYQTLRHLGITGDLRCERR